MTPIAPPVNMVIDSDHDGMNRPDDPDDLDDHNPQWLDADGDGVHDMFDKFPLNMAASTDTDGDGFPNSWNSLCDITCQINSGLALDNCPSTANADQLDTDHDGMGDACDVDDDNDGVVDVGDAFPLDPTQVGDIDGDGIDGRVDNCPAISNANQLDTDHDGIGDVCDSDDDSDGILDVSDKFPLNVAASIDSDNDGFPDGWNASCDANCQLNSGLMLDNCPSNANADQLDTDHDGSGDACDSDDDNDGVLDASDKFPLNAAVSIDSDNDGFPNGWNASCDAKCQANSGLTLDNCPSNANADQLDADQDGVGDVCDLDVDGDGVADVSDNCPLIANANQADSDGDAVGDACDPQPLHVTIAVAIALSGSGSCLLAASGGVKCWGDNYYGQLGDGTTTNRSAPIDVVGLMSGVSAIAGGGYNNCALMMSDGVKCWGYNTYGQLGDGTTTNRTTPVDVSGLTSGVSAIATGYYHTCALMINGGVKCWGYNGYGELGDGTTTNQKTPVDVSGMTSGVSAIAAGAYYTCALTTSGGVKCWGNNIDGQLGDGTTTNRTAPVDVSGLTSGVSAIATGYYHTCALMINGGVKCWGYNAYGQLGVGTTTNQKTPVDVSGMMSGVSAIAAGGYHNCAVTTSGGVKCWGANGSGQLGDSTTTTRGTPVDVSGLTSGVIAIAGSASHTCALTTSGGVKCWGYNAYGQLGDSSTTQRNTPVTVFGFSGDTDHDGIADNVDTDDDNDTVLDVNDNCPLISNSDQLNTDGDTQGNVCDADDDNDGVLDINDAFPLDASESVDTDADGIGNNADWDDDNDGVPDNIDAAPLNAADAREITLPLNGVYKGLQLQSREGVQ